MTFPLWFTDSSGTSAACLSPGFLKGLPTLAFCNVAFAANALQTLLRKGPQDPLSQEHEPSWGQEAGREALLPSPEDQKGLSSGLLSKEYR